MSKSELSATHDLIAGIRDLVREAQRELVENPDPTSPWWFLVEPESA